jgi:hypothetical protein
MAFWMPLLMAALKGAAGTAGGAAVGAAIPKKGMTSPGQVQQLDTPDTSQGFSRLLEGTSKKPRGQELTIEDLKRLGGM